MRQGFWTMLGVVLTGAMVVLSAFINYSSGYSPGTTEANARIFGAVSVVAVGMMALLPLRSAMHWEAGRKGRAALAAGMFAILGLSVLLALVIESVCCLASWFSWPVSRPGLKGKSHCRSGLGAG
jgi:cellobiose-specific phosphotransferase system component IIC